MLDVMSLVVAKWTCEILMMRKYQRPIVSGTSLHIALCCLLVLAVVATAGAATSKRKATPVLPRDVLARQPDFLADLTATNRVGNRKLMTIAKKGHVYRLEYKGNGAVYYYTPKFATWKLDAVTGIAEPRGYTEMSVEDAPWTVLQLVTELPCFRIEAIGAEVDRDGSPRRIAVYAPSDTKAPMMCFVSGGKGLVTRIEFTQSDDPWVTGYNQYQLSNIRYVVPEELLSVPLTPQQSDYVDWDLCADAGAT